MTSMMLALALPTVVLTGAGPAWLTRCCWPRTPCSSRCCRRRSCAGSPGCAAPAASRAPPRCGCSGAACSRSSASAAGSTATVVLVRRHAALHGGRGGARADLDGRRRGRRARRRPGPLPRRVPVLVRRRLGDRARVLRRSLRRGPRAAVPGARPRQRAERARPPAAGTQPAVAGWRSSSPTDQRPAAHRAPSISAAASATGTTLTSTSRCWRGDRAREVAEHVLQPPGVGGGEVLAAGEVRHLAQGALVGDEVAAGAGPAVATAGDRRVGAAVALEAPAAELGRRADHRRRVAGAEPDRVDADAALRGGLRGVDRLDAAWCWRRR